MSVKKNKRIVERWNEEVFVQKKVDVIDELAHADYKHTTTGINGREEAKEAIRKAFAEGREFSGLDAIATIAERDYVVQVRKSGVVVYRLAGGKIIEDSVYNKPEPQK